MKRTLLAALVFGFALAAPVFSADERQVVTKVAPTYPLAAKQLRLAGEVKVQAEVDDAGNVTNAKAISGNMVLTKAAVEAVMKWKYKPGPKTSVTVVLNFTL